MVVLRTLAYNESGMGEVHVGIQESAKGIYMCVATNFNETTNKTFEINPTGTLIRDRVGCVYENKQCV